MLEVAKGWPKPGEPLPPNFKMVEFRGGQYDGAVLPWKEGIGHVALQHGALPGGPPTDDLFEVYILRGEIAQFFVTATEAEALEAHRRYDARRV